ncbi:uncharacterized protein LOC143230718 [Tachypleus tridentatus]|uniref:uncharacterized protein LOC143230718 n=1 Tax=Tachypleus tridentatus TaxID=6853 RepID=UPI003FD695E5
MEIHQDVCSFNIRHQSRNSLNSFALDTYCSESFRESITFVFLWRMFLQISVFTAFTQVETSLFYVLLATINILGMYWSERCTKPHTHRNLSEQPLCFNTKYCSASVMLP